MTTLYKLTDRHLRTHGDFQWVVGEDMYVSGLGELCGPGFLHAYTDPLLAVLLAPIHVSFGDDVRLFEADDDVAKTDLGLKVGCTRLRLVCELELPTVTLEQRVRFAIFCAQEVVDTQYPRWSAWAERWLSGEDRSADAAWVEAWVEARITARTAAQAAATRATLAAARAETRVTIPVAAERAAQAAAEHAVQTTTQTTVRAAARALLEMAAEQAAQAAQAAAWTRQIDLITIAKRAVSED